MHKKLSHARHTQEYKLVYKVQTRSLTNQRWFCYASFAAGFGVRGCRLLCSHLIQKKKKNT